MSSQDYSRSLLTRFRDWQFARRGTIVGAIPWLLPALIAAIVSIVVAWLPHHLNAPKPDQQMQPHAGEFLLRCVQERDNILRCRPVISGENQVIPSPHADGLKDNRPTKK